MNELLSVLSEIDGATVSLRYVSEPFTIRGYEVRGTQWGRCAHLDVRLDSGPALTATADWPELIDQLADIELPSRWTTRCCSDLCDGRDYLILVPADEGQEE